MAVAVASSARAASTSNGTSIVIGKPTGLAEGDILLAFIFNDNGGLATPSGWTAVGSQVAGDGNGFALQFATFAKIAEASDVAASNFTFAMTLDNLRLGYLFRITGDFSVGSISDYFSVDTDNNATDVSDVFTFTGGITPKGANSLLMMAVIGGASGYSGSNPFSAFSVANSNPSWSIQYNEGYAGGVTDSILAGVASAPFVSGGATGDYSVTSSATSREVGGLLLSINEVTNVTATLPHLAVSPTFYKPTPSVNINAELPHLSVSPEFYKPTAKGTTPTNWNNELPPTTDWSNEQLP